MAIFNNNINNLNGYTKIASNNDYCYLCAKKKNIKEKGEIFETIKQLKGKITGQKVVFLRRSGIDTCICFDCIKDIYETEINPETKKDKSPIVELQDNKEIKIEKIENKDSKEVKKETKKTKKN